jgi:hypothetical protein
MLSHLIATDRYSAVTELLEGNVESLLADLPCAFASLNSTADKALLPTAHRARSSSRSRLAASTTPGYKLSVRMRWCLDAAKG